MTDLEFVKKFGYTELSHSCELDDETRDRLIITIAQKLGIKLFGKTKPGSGHFEVKIIEEE